MHPSSKQGKLVVISGPSGVGKSTITRRVVRNTDAVLSVSATTRPRGAAETNGQDYYFLSVEDFQRKLADGEFLEYADVFGNLYGTPREPVVRAIDEGKTVILEIDVQGGLQVRERMPEAMMIFVLPPHMDELLKRIEKRGRGEDEQTRRRRLDKAAAEIAQGRAHYDHFVVNDDLDRAVEKVTEMIQTA